MHQQEHDHLIVLDWDHTLFNTTSFVVDLENELEKLGLPKEKFIEKRNLVKAKYEVFDFDKMAELFEEVDSKDVHGAVEAVLGKHAREYIFDDVDKFIKKHQNNFDIIILTQGDIELQSKKLKHSGFISFPNIITMKSKAEELTNIVSDYKTVYFIDDKAKNVDEVKTAFPEVITYFIKRPEDNPYGKVDTICKCADNKIENLNFVI